MANIHLKQLVDFPAKIINRIGGDAYCVGLILDKPFDEVTEEDLDMVIDRNLFDYQYVNLTPDKSTVYVWVEVDIPSVMNQTIKDVYIYVTVACHKDYMKLDGSKFRGIVGNRRDNVVAYIDSLLNDTFSFGIGRLALKSVQTRTSINDFTIKEIEYRSSDFNLTD